MYKYLLMGAHAFVKQYTCYIEKRVHQKTKTYH